ncbi:hypothetical protein M0R45_016187 [Rubus argutus]|uniref:Uncharacterized protein n=1 Tax=Rubus argutus TaxID=59490 RepID=A0AAW1XRR3_RUBAR
MLIQPGKRAKVADSIPRATGLELVVAPQLTLETKDGRIIISPSKNKKRGRPVGAKYRLKGDMIAVVAIAERPNPTFERERSSRRKDRKAIPNISNPSLVWHCCRRQDLHSHRLNR